MIHSPPEAQPLSEDHPHAVPHGQEHGDHQHGVHTHIPLGYGKRTWLRVLIGSIVMAAALAGVYIVGTETRHQTRVFLKKKSTEAVEARPHVTTVRAQASEPTHTLELPGQVRALFETTLHARSTGYLTALNVDIGDRVKKGQVLAVIEMPELQAQLIEARAKIGADKADLTLAQANARFAKISVDRYKAAAPEGGVSQQELDQKVTELQVAEARIEAQKAKVALSEAELEKLEALVSFGNMTAPFDGTITQRWVDVGALITAGSTSSTMPLLRIEQTDTVRVVVDVPQRAAVDVANGQVVTVSLAEAPNLKFAGKIERTSDSIDRAGTLRVEALVPNPDHKLMTGMYVTTTFTQPASIKAVRIPASALSFRTAGPQVAVVAPDGKVSFHAVTISNDLGDFVEVSDGLQPDQTIALNISSYVREGDFVTPDDSAKAAAAK